MKSAKFDMDQIMGLLLAVGAVFVLFMLAFTLFAPSFDKKDKGAKGYFDTLMGEVAIANDGGEGEFSLWQQTGEDMDFFLIYFGDKYKFSIGERSFMSMGSDNRICICYWDDEEGVCDYCESLEYPIKYDEKYDPWIVATGERISIKKGGEFYEFVKIAA